MNNINIKENDEEFVDKFLQQFSDPIQTDKVFIYYIKFQNI